MGERSSQVTSTGRFDDVRTSGAFDSLAEGEEAASDADPAAIVEDIEQTRADLSETLDAIQERLAPERISDQAKDAASEAAEQAKSAALEAIDHALKEARVVVQEWGELASVSALEAADRTLQQANETAREVIDHALQEAKNAVRDMTDQAKASVREATIGRVERVATKTSDTSKGLGANIVATVKQNPGTAALTALGLGWLFVNRQSAESQPQRTTTAQYSGTSTLRRDQNQWASGERGYAGATTGEHRQDGTAVGDIAGQVQNTAGDVVDQVQSTVGQVASQTQETAGQVAEQVQETASQVAEQVQRMPNRVLQMVETSPLPLGLASVALGAATALALPKTQRENELMGEARDNLVHQAEASAQNVVQKVQRVAEEAGEAAEKEAKYQGLSPEK